MKTWTRRIYGYYQADCQDLTRSSILDFSPDSLRRTFRYQLFIYEIIGHPNSIKGYLKQLYSLKTLTIYLFNKEDIWILSTDCQDLTRSTILDFSPDSLRRTFRFQLFIYEIIGHPNSIKSYFKQLYSMKTLTICLFNKEDIWIASGQLLEKFDFGLYT